MKNDSTNTTGVKMKTKELAQVPMPKLNTAQLAIIQNQTPVDKIKKHSGRGGTQVSYVEIGYVLSQLNEAFGFMWSFEVLHEEVKDDQVWVKGELKIHITPEFFIVKHAYGGSELKKYTTGVKTGAFIDLADDLKSASADALKKAASMVGIAADVFYPVNKNHGLQSTPPRTFTPAATVVTPSASNKFQAPKLVCPECHAVGNYHSKTCARNGEIIH